MQILDVAIISNFSILKWIVSSVCHGHRNRSHDTAGTSLVFPRLNAGRTLTSKETRGNSFRREKINKEWREWQVAGGERDKTQSTKYKKI